jgi:hypothetical protein
MSSIKEPLFFAVEGESEPFHGPQDNQGIRSLEAYCSLFLGVRNERAIGEVSPLYVYSQKAPYRIEHYIPDVKIMAILCNPVDRAYSHFLQHRLLGNENLNDFREAIEAEEKREQMGWSPYWLYRKQGVYSKQLSRYLSSFQNEQIKVFLFEDLLYNAKGLFRDITEFLDLDRGFDAKTPSKRNVSGYPRSEKLHSFLTQPNFTQDYLVRFYPRVHG